MNTSYISPEHHKNKIIQDVSRWLDAKYDAGQSEHGGSLWRKPTLSQAWLESLDLIIYLHVLQEHIQQILHITQEAASGNKNPDIAIQEIYNIITAGNAEGIPEHTQEPYA